ncbi:MAG: glycerophosphodiester phosphodiesterase [Propionibacteriaceae bacterium]|nr:glycerophosphodiester phosphodiesterase [Propionibacteriaceae bacterium]
MFAQDYPYCSPRFVAMAHRGGSYWEPNLGKENTLFAFSQAVSLGYRYIETDVQATRDARLVCMHDETLERVAHVAGRVADYTAAELSQITLISGEPIPFFDDVVEALPQTRFNVDLKVEGAIVPLVKAIMAHRLHNRILVDSFSQARLSRFRSLTHGQIPTAMAPPGVAWTAFVPLASAIVSSPGVAVQVPRTQKIGVLTVPVVTRGMIARVHALGKVIHVWTVDEVDDMEQLIDLGVDGIITDRPDRLARVLAGRDLWETQ